MGFCLSCLPIARQLPLFKDTDQGRLRGVHRCIVLACSLEAGGPHLREHILLLFRFFRSPRGSRDTFVMLRGIPGGLRSFSCFASNSARVMLVALKLRFRPTLRHTLIYLPLLSYFPPEMSNNLYLCANVAVDGRNAKQHPFLGDSKHGCLPSSRGMFSQVPNYFCKNLCPPPWLAIIYFVARPVDAPARQAHLCVS